MTSRILVLGAGMIGISTGLQLALRGHAVTVVDRRDPGRETSYGNAGIIQREAVEPHPFPRDLPTLLRVALGRGADVHYHASALPGLASPLLRYWSASAPQRYAPIAQAYARLIAHCTDEHQPLIGLAGAEDLISRDGYRYVFRDEASLARSIVEARQRADTYGLRISVLDGQAMADAEPALHARVAGGIQWHDAWPVNDPGELVARYARAFVARGGDLQRGDAGTLRPKGSGWSLRTEAGEVDTEQVVVALGPWSDAFVQTLGYRYPLFVKRGYHRHYRSATPPTMPMYDTDRGLVISPMRQGVRVTTGAEFARIDAPATPIQVDRTAVMARELVTLGEPVEADPWLGARPCTADMLPVIGAAPRHRGLWFNFGHAHQGFTLGPICGRLLAEMIAGEATVVDPTPYAPTRFG